MHLASQDQNSHIFALGELEIIKSNVALMQGDIQSLYREVVDQSHHGRPILVQQVRTGEPGRPSYHIDRDFLAWAYCLRSTASIARFLGVSRSVVRNALLEYGIASPQENPFPMDAGEGGDSTADGDHAATDPILDPHTAPLPFLPNTADGFATPTTPAQASGPVSYTGPLSAISDDQLDGVVKDLRSAFPRAGASMIDGMLRTFGLRVPRDRIRLSLNRIDPVHRVFDRIRIRRRIYSVPGPMSLWHHDGQHGTALTLS